MYVGEIGCEGVDWIQLAQGSVQQRVLVNTVINILVPEKTIGLSE
jgi:hypothetical protein